MSHYLAIIIEIFKVDSDQISDDVDIVQLSNGEYHILYKGRSFTARVIEKKTRDHGWILSLNGQRVEVRLQSKFDQFIDEFRSRNSEASSTASIKAPIPGRVLKVYVSPSQGVKKGEPLLILEAMKMENIISAPSDAEVDTIHIQEGSVISKGDLLITFKPN